MKPATSQPSYPAQKARAPKALRLPIKANRSLDSDLNPAFLRPPVPFGCTAPLRELYPLKHHQEEFDQLEASGVTLDPKLTLNALREAKTADLSPPHTMATIVKYAILGAPKKRLTLLEITIVIRRRFHYYAITNVQSWNKTIRFCLSMFKEFVKVPKEPTSGDAGAWWTISDDGQHPGAPTAVKSTSRQRTKAAEAARSRRNGSASSSSSGSTTIRKKGFQGYSYHSRKAATTLPPPEALPPFLSLAQPSCHPLPGIRNLGLPNFGRPPPR